MKFGPIGREVATLMRTNYKRADIISNVKTATRLFHALSAISPKSKTKVTSGLAVDLADLEHVGKRHRRVIRTLCRLRLPRDKKQVERALAQIEVNLLFEAQYHLSSIKRLLPIFIADMSKSTRR